MPTAISYSDIFNTTTNGVIVTDAKGYLTHINRQAEKILGFRARRHIGKFISDLLPMTGPQIIACLESGEPNIGHLIKGKVVDLVLFITLSKSGGRVQGAVCTFQEMGQFEMSARKLESYQQLNRELAAIFDASSDGLWVCDHKGNVTNINKASARLNGIKTEEIIGRNITDLVASGLFDRSVTVEVIETRRQVSIMQYVKRTNRYLLATGTPVFDDQGNLHIVVVNERDMTQLNVMREELEQTQMVTEKIRDELTELRLLERKHQAIIAESKEMRQVLTVALKLARLDASNILILGESGTGKGLMARFIHKNSIRAKKPFIPINCAALPESLLEAELFGYERGAFTGAREQGKVGLFELAHEGVLFLDEIGDLPLTLQAKLLKYLDDHEIMRLGGVKARHIDCTVIAATNRDIEEQVKKRRFRGDLFYRLNAFTIHIPALRSRPEDIFELIQYYMTQYNRAYGTQCKLMPETLERLQNYAFPGNVRELKNLIKRAVVVGESEMLDGFLKHSLDAARSSATSESYPGSTRARLADDVNAFEKEILRRAVRQCRTTRELASAIGVSQPTAVRKMKKFGFSFSNDSSLNQKMP
jgi:PAS domain S-box-containing protein